MEGSTRPFHGMVVWALLCTRQLSPVNGMVGISLGLCGHGAT